MAKFSEHRRWISRISKKFVYGVIALMATFTPKLTAAQTAATSTYKVLYAFAGLKSGSRPAAGVIRDATGNLYGTTVYAGMKYGVVFKVAPAGEETVLHSFTGGVDGASSWAGLLRDAAGNLFGTTVSGGANGIGTIFKLDPTGKETVLHSFGGGSDGVNPYAGLVLDPAGNFYGTTFLGGDHNSGVVFELDSAGKETVLYSFTGGADGSGPLASLVRDAVGNLYGTASFGGISNCTSGCGTVFKLDTTGKLTILHSFTGGKDGGNSRTGLVRDAAGNLYGTTIGGGINGVGVVFKIDTSGKQSILHNFFGSPDDGATPRGGLVRDSAGNLYGTTSNGGAQGRGVVFRLSSTGKETILYTFTGGSDGGNPLAGLVRDAAGNLYGTTFLGGTSNNGVVFKLTP
jgi:uncharacterized repeat protein (TIGR03803 family)